jgi:hypothetical protein
MPNTLREFVSAKLIDSGIERSMETRELERSIAGIPDGRVGLATAHYAVRSAKRRDALRLWLGWRLQPRHFDV